MIIMVTGTWNSMNSRHMDVFGTMKILSILPIFLMPSFITGDPVISDLDSPKVIYHNSSRIELTISYDLNIRNGKADEAKIFPLGPKGIFTDEDGNVLEETDSYQLSHLADLEKITFEGQDISYWVLNNVIGIYHIEARMNLTSIFHLWEIEKDDYGHVEDIDRNQWSRYLSNAYPVDINADGHPDHYYYDPEDPLVRTEAYNLTRNVSSVLEKMEMIHTWIRDNFEYLERSSGSRDQRVYGDHPKWPGGCLEDRTGDRFDLSFLMASMLRAIGIPAWVVFGYQLDPVLEDIQASAWIRSVIPDPEGGGFTIVPIGIVNREFLIHSPYKFTFMEDKGTELLLENRTIYNLDLFYDFYRIKKPAGVECTIDRSVSLESFHYEGRRIIWFDDELRERIDTLWIIMAVATPVVLLAILVVVVIGLKIHGKTVRNEKETLW